MAPRGGSSTVEPQPSKLMTRVRFPSAACSVPISRGPRRYLCRQQVRPPRALLELLLQALLDGFGERVVRSLICQGLLVLVPALLQRGGALPGARVGHRVFGHRVALGRSGHGDRDHALVGAEAEVVEALDSDEVRTDEVRV